MCFTQTKHNHLVGLAFGSFLGLMHLGWMILVGLKWAKPFMDWVLDLHHVTLQYNISDLNILKGLMLVIFTFVVGYIMGWLLYAVWNVVKK